MVEKLKNWFNWKETQVIKQNYYKNRGYVLAVTMIITLSIIVVIPLIDSSVWSTEYLIVGLGLMMVIFVIFMIIGAKLVWPTIFIVKESTQGDLIGYECKGEFFADFGEAEASIESVLIDIEVPRKKED